MPKFLDRYHLTRRFDTFDSAKWFAQSQSKELGIQHVIHKTFPYPLFIDGEECHIEQFCDSDGELLEGWEHLCEWTVTLEPSSKEQRRTLNSLPDSIRQAYDYYEEQNAFERHLDKLDREAWHRYVENQEWE